MSNHVGWWGGWLSPAGAGWAALLVVLALWMLGARNRLTALRGGILQAWGPVDAALRARGQALATVLAHAAAPLAGEQSALDAVAQALAQVQAGAEALRKRPASAAAAAELAKADAVLAALNQRLLALVEQAADLRREPDVQAALASLKGLVPQLQFARQGFNDAVVRYNTALAEFPTRLLAPVFRLEPAGSL